MHNHHHLINIFSNKHQKFVLTQETARNCSLKFISENLIVESINNNLITKKQKDKLKISCSYDSTFSIHSIATEETIKVKTNLLMPIDHVPNQNTQYFVKKNNVINPIDYTEILHNQENIFYMPSFDAIISSIHIDSIDTKLSWEIECVVIS